MQINIFFCQHH